MTGCTCGDAQREIEEYLQRECCEERRDEIRRRLACCPECFGELEISERLVDRVRECCQEAAPSEVRTRVLAAIRVTPCASSGDC